jgi:hypothetical protein
MTACWSCTEIVDGGLYDVRLFPHASACLSGVALGSFGSESDLDVVGQMTGWSFSLLQLESPCEADDPDSLFRTRGPVLVLLFIFFLQSRHSHRVIARFTPQPFQDLQVPRRIYHRSRVTQVMRVESVPAIFQAKPFLPFVTGPNKRTQDAVLQRLQTLRELTWSIDNAIASNPAALDQVLPAHIADVVDHSIGRRCSSSGFRNTLCMKGRRLYG